MNVTLDSSGVIQMMIYGTFLHAQMLQNQELRWIHSCLRGIRYTELFYVYVRATEFRIIFHFCENLNIRQQIQLIANILGYTWIFPDDIFLISFVKWCEIGISDESRWEQEYCYMYNVSRIAVVWQRIISASR